MKLIAEEVFRNVTSRTLKAAADKQAKELSVRVQILRKRFGVPERAATPLKKETEENAYAA